jgi:hypothetical protein
MGRSNLETTLRTVLLAPRRSLGGRQDRHVGSRNDRLATASPRRPRYTCLPVACSVHPLRFIAPHWMPTETTIQSGAPCKPSLAASGLPSEPTVPPNWSNVVAQARAAARVEDSSSELALAHSLFAAYKGGHEVVCLAEALTLFRRLHKSSSTNDIGQVTLDYGEALYAEYRRSGQIEPINDLLAIHEQSPPCPDSLQARLDLQRANAFLARGTFTSNQKDIAEAKKLMDACAPPHSAESFDFEAAVVSAAYHSIVWFMTGQNDREAFRHLSHGLLMHLKSQHPLQRRADVLSTCLRIIPSSLFFNESVDLDVKEATELAEETVLTIDSRREPLPDRALIMHDLARFYYFLANSDPANMQKSGQLIEQALYAAGDNNIDRSGAFLARGDWLWKSRAVFGAGNSSMFEDAAVQYRKALNHCPRWHTRRTQCLVGLSCNLVDQFNQAGACAGLKEIITLSEHHPDVLQSSPLFVLNVTEAFMLRTKAGRLRPPAKQALLQRAASTLKVALANIPESHTYRCALLVQLNLVYVLLDRFGYPIGEGEHLSVARRSASTKASAAHHWLSLFYLATALLGFASRRRDLEMLQESFLLVERLATDTTTSRWNLDLAALHASCHMVRFGILGETADLKTAERMFESSDPAQHSDFSGWMALRLERFTTWARLARYAAQPMSEMCAYRRAIDLLPRLAYIGEDSGTQVEAVQLAQGIACRAAALALTLDDAPRALELLEESRSVVWSQSLHLRVSPTAIPPQHMIAFQQSIESLKSASGPAERHGHAAQLEATIADIRQVEGYDRFLLPRVYGELRSCASHGVVVVLIPSETFTDVVTIRDPTSTPTHLRLAALKLSRLQDLTAKFRRANNRYRDAESMRKVKKVGIADRRLSVTNTKEGPTDVLHQLWTSLVHPIITSLEMKVCKSMRSMTGLH